MLKPNSTSNSTGSSGSLNQTDLILVSVFSFVGACLIVAALWVCIRRRRAKAQRTAQEKDASLLEPQFARAPSSTYPSELASPHHMTELPDHQLDFPIPPVPVRYVEPIDHPVEMSAEQYMHDQQSVVQLEDQELEGDMHHYPPPLPSQFSDSGSQRGGVEAGGLANHPPPVPPIPDTDSQWGGVAGQKSRSQTRLGGDAANRSQLGLDAASVGTGSYYHDGSSFKHEGSEWEDGGDGEGEPGRPPPMMVHEQNSTDREGRHDAVSTRSVSPLGDEDRLVEEGEEAGQGK